MNSQNINDRDQETAMIFVVGNSRSGTTMMSNILENHRGVYKFHELHFFEELWIPEENEKTLTEAEAVNMAARLLASQRDDYIFNNMDRYIDEAKGIVQSMDSNLLRAVNIYSAFLSYEMSKNSCETGCESTPRNVFYIKEILDIFPEAMIINLVRDPRDILLSQKRKWRRSYLRAGGRPLKETIRVMTNYHPFTISKLWKAAVGAADKFNGHKRVFILHYEDILTKPEEAVQNICSFLGIRYDDSLLDIPHTGSSLVKDSKEKGIRRNKGPKWQGGGLNSTEIYLCQKITAAYMNKYGYEPAEVSPNLFLLIFYIISFPVKLGLALLLNLGRMRSIVDTIKRRLS